MSSSSARCLGVDSKSWNVFKKNLWQDSYSSVHVYCDIKNVFNKWYVLIVFFSKYFINFDSGRQEKLVSKSLSPVLPAIHILTLCLYAILR